MAIDALFYLLHLGLLLFSAWLSAVIRYWHAWTVYALVTILLLTPVSVISYAVFCLTKHLCAAPRLFADINVAEREVCPPRAPMRLELHRPCRAPATTAAIELGPAKPR